MGLSLQHLSGALPLKPSAFRRLIISHGSTCLPWATQKTPLTSIRPFVSILQMGYDLARFVLSTTSSVDPTSFVVDEELICPICSGVLQEPVHTPQCEHAFCKKCINNWLTQSTTCPIDRSPITPEQVHPRIWSNSNDSLIDDVHMAPWEQNPCCIFAQGHQRL